MTTSLISNEDANGFPIFPALEQGTQRLDRGKDQLVN
jgi:hypothetical protein